ncbi:hypothetical protein Mcup_1808 [Metallosphaera cuprina Ar-4]|uniref:Uncharacterized protein n=1 Tax=Metallosphaera cuprina (strain Ar-4) TaxID=1006006 RepID=F4G0V1_METCR|nr:hypothetical protein Mcup_1808 [Metallosphaera cuprina Ar-4]
MFKSNAVAKIKVNAINAAESLTLSTLDHENCPFKNINSSHAHI